VALTIGTLVGYLDVDNSKFNAGVDAAGNRFGGLAKGIKIAALGIAGAALGGLAEIIKTGINETLDASKGEAQLAAGIKSTGNAAHVSVSNLEKLASTIQGYSGQTDDSIVATEQLLLTFTKIKNVGANKIFDMATVAAANMAAKLGGDASASAIQLGKALNDPIKGVTALQRVGVSFTDAQKAQIKAMAESGNVMGAQKIILAELNTEFGGAAKAAGESLPGQLSRAKRAFEDMAQGAVAAIIPVLLPALTLVTSGLKLIAPVIGEVAGFIKTAIADAAAWVRSHWATIGPIISQVWDTLRSGLVAVWAIVNPILAEIVATVATIVGFIKAHWDSIGPVVAAVWTSIKTIIGGALNLISGIIRTVMALIRGDWSGAWDGIKNIVSGVLNVVKGVISGAMELIKGLFSAGWGALKGIVSAAWGGISDALSAGWGAVKTWFSGLGKRITGAVGDLGSVLYNAGKAVIEGFWNGLKAMWDSVTGWFSGIGSWIAKHKGPLDYDRQLLVPHGAAIMDGFMDGLQGKIPALQRTLSGITASINIGGGAASGTALGGGITINGPVIGAVHASTPAQAEALGRAAIRGIVAEARGTSAININPRLVGA